MARVQFALHFTQFGVICEHPRNSSGCRRLSVPYGVTVSITKLSLTQIATSRITLSHVYAKLLKLPAAKIIPSGYLWF